MSLSNYLSRVLARCKNDEDLNKSEFTRYNIVSDMLKTVVIRIDFAKVHGFDDFVSSNKQFLLSYFEHYQRISTQMNNMVQRNPCNNWVPVEDNTKSEFHRFYSKDCEDCPDVSLDITDTAFILVIKVNKFYTGSTFYSGIMTDICKQALKYNADIKVSRIGVRKFDEIEVGMDEPTNKYFSNTLSLISGVLDPAGGVCYRSQFEARLINNIHYNCNQTLQVSNDRSKYRVRFDMDAYSDRASTLTEALKKRPQKKVDDDPFFVLLDKTIQDPMFDIYRSWMSYEYLRKHKHE